MTEKNLTKEPVGDLEEDQVEPSKSTTASQKKANSFYTSSSSSSSGNSRAVKKWYTHIMGGDHPAKDDKKKPTTAEIEKIMAVYRVQYPFLPESQLRGKAWKSTGYVSHMGQTPRSLLTS
ncbi:hypothetical protein TKK_0019298 [Trichogramma kaykai]